MLDSDEKAELVELLSSCDPKHFVSLPAKAPTTRLRHILPFYIPMPKAELFAIWEGQEGLAQGEPVFENGFGRR